MPPSIPPRFVNVSTARSRQGFVNVIGVVVDFLAPTRTNGSSYVVTFTIKDFELEKEPWNGLKIKYFNDNEHLLPDLIRHDVVLLRQIRVRPHQGSLVGVASQWDQVPWAIFRQSEDPGALITPACSPRSAEPTSQEKAYANSLLNSVVQNIALSEHVVTGSRPETTTSDPQKVQMSKRKDKFSLVKDLSTGTFVDLVVHVVKTFPEDSMFQLYVTDYTVNKELFHREKQPYNENNDGTQGIPGDELNYMPPRLAKREWTGPTGQRTLQVALWYPHGDFAREHIEVDSYVALSNVHIKLGHHGKLEGIIHQDKLYPDKICIRLLDDDDNDNPRFIELKKRKREYWTTNRPNKRQLLEGESGASSRKKAKKKRKEQQKNRKQQPPKLEDGQIVITDSLDTKIYETNGHIRSRYPDIECRSISSILSNVAHHISLSTGIRWQLPFQNLCYRTTVRVVDFFPPRIEDFAVRYISRSGMQSAFESGSDEDLEMAASQSPNSRFRIKWEWRFCLLVEDAKIISGRPAERIKLFISGEDAEHLLRLDATNLRETEETFRQLREKMFIVWGDLEERKNRSPGGRMDLENRAVVSQVPFDCCVKEYGVPCGCQANDDAMIDEGGHQNGCLGWERRFAMFGTTII